MEQIDCLKYDKNRMGIIVPVILVGGQKTKSMEDEIQK